MNIGLLFLRHHKVFFWFVFSDTLIRLFDLTIRCTIMKNEFRYDSKWTEIPLMLVWPITWLSPSGGKIHSSNPFFFICDLSWGSASHTWPLVQITWRLVWYLLHIVIQRLSSEFCLMWLQNIFYFSNETGGWFSMDCPWIVSMYLSSLSWLLLINISSFINGGIRFSWEFKQLLNICW